MSYFCIDGLQLLGSINFLRAVATAQLLIFSATILVDNFFSLFTCQKAEVFCCFAQVVGTPDTHKTGTCPGKSGRMVSLFLMKLRFEAGKVSFALLGLVF